MKDYNYEGWRTVTIKQYFTVKANSQAEANAKLWEMQNDYELEDEWFDYQSNKIKGSDEAPDFYDADDNLVEETV